MIANRLTKATLTRVGPFELGMNNLHRGDILTAITANLDGAIVAFARKESGGPTDGSGR